MAKLTLAQLEAELSGRLAGVIAATDTAGLDAALSRAIRFIDSLASYTFLQKRATGSLVSGALTLPTDINLSKEVKMYVNGVKLSYVPWSELSTYQTAATLFPTAVAYDPVNGKLQTNGTLTSTHETFYTKIMTFPADGPPASYCEIPEQWYDLILDVAQYQQMAKYGMMLSEEIKSYTKDRLIQFVREFNATLGSVVNINDEAIRNGG